MNTYYIEQRAEIWVRATVEAANAVEAMELGLKEIENGNYVENPESFELQGDSNIPTNDFWIGGGADGVSVSLNNDGSITELRITE